MPLAPFRHLLVACDGSRQSRRAIRRAIGLARSLGAKLTALYVVAPYFRGSAGIEALPGFRPAIQREARAHLASFNAAARAAGMTATATSVVGGEPWQEILRVARRRRCDLIVMASHGRRGLSALLLGSETVKVLTHSKIPVLVCR